MATTSPKRAKESETETVARSWTPRPILGSDYTDDPSLQDVYVGLLKRKQDISIAIRTVSAVLPGFGHLKRCSSNKLLLAPVLVSDLSGKTQEPLSVEARSAQNEDTSFQDEDGSNRDRDTSSQDEGRLARDGSVLNEGTLAQGKGRLSQDKERSSQGTDRFFQEEGRLIQGKGRLYQDESRLSQDKGTLSQEKSGLSQDTERFLQEEGRLTQGKGTLSQDEGGLSQDTDRFFLQEGRLTPDEGTLSQEGGGSSQGKGTLYQDESRLNQDKGGLTQNKRTLSQDENKLSQDKGTLSQEGGGLSQGKGTLSQDKSRLNQDKGGLTQNKRTLSQEEGGLSQGKGTLSQDEDRSAQDEGRFGQDKVTQSQDEGKLNQDNVVQSRDEGRSSQDKVTLPRDEGKSSQDEDTFTQSEGTLTQCEGGLTQNGSTLTENKVTLTQDELKSLLRGKGFDLTLLEDDFEVVKVPARAAKTKSQSRRASRIWPVNFHPDPDIESLIDGSIFTDHQLELIERYMTVAVEATRLEAIGNDNCNGSSVIVDPEDGRILAIAASQIDRHPMWHAAMLAVDLVAELQGGGAWKLREGNSTESYSSEANEDPRESRLRTIKRKYLEDAPLRYPRSLSVLRLPKEGTLKSLAPRRGRRNNDKARTKVIENTESVPSEKCGPYLCTGYWTFLTMEPCPLCAMALLHSRVSRIFYGVTNPCTGVLGSRSVLHAVPGLNHRYRVWSGVLEQECRLALREAAHRDTD